MDDAERENGSPWKGIHEQRQLLRKLYAKDVREKIQQTNGNQYRAIAILDDEQNVAYSRHQP